jgi:hypothetical protein
MPGPQEAEPGKGGVDQVEPPGRTACASPDRASPPAIQWGPGSREVGTRKGVTLQGDRAEVPTAPTVPTENDKGRNLDEPDAHVAAWYAWGERAAWLEFGCGWSRADAERQATAEIVG